MSLHESRKRLQTEVALVKLLKALDGQAGYDLDAMKAEAQATLDSCNEDPPAILVPDGYVAVPIEALKPFAEVAEDYRDWEDQDVLTGAPPRARVGHLRQIAKALAASPYPPEGLETTKG